MQQYLPLILVTVTNLVPVGLWAWLYLSRDPSREPRILLLFAFLIGGLTTFPVMLINSLAGSFGGDLLPWHLAALVFPVLGAAVVEEMCKHCGVIFVMNQDRHAQDEVLDGIIYAVVTALGFAFVENTVYIWLSLWQAGTLTQEVIGVYVLRSMLSMFGHTIFSGFFGYYYALGFIAPRLRAAADRQKISMRGLASGARLSALSFRATSRLIRGKTDKVNSFQLLLEGLWLAAILHMLYNLFLTWPPFGINPFLVVTPYLGLLGMALMAVIVHVRRGAR